MSGDQPKGIECYGEEDARPLDDGMMSPPVRAVR